MADMQAPLFPIARRRSVGGMEPRDALSTYPLQKFDSELHTSVALSISRLDVDETALRALCVVKVV